MGMLQNVRDILYIVNGSSEGGGGGGETSDTVTHDEMNAALSRKQDALQYDAYPIHGSKKSVNSEGLAKTLLHKMESLTAESKPDNFLIEQLDSATINAAYATLQNYGFRYGYAVPKFITLYRRKSETAWGTFYLRILRYRDNKWTIVAYSKNAIDTQQYTVNGEPLGPWEMVMMPGEGAIPTDEQVAITFITDPNQPANQTFKFGLKAEVQSGSNFLVTETLVDGRRPSTNRGRIVMSASYTFSNTPFVDNEGAVTAAKFNAESERLTGLCNDASALASDRQLRLIAGTNVSITDGPDTPDGKKRQTISVTGSSSVCPQATSKTLGGIKVAEKNEGTLASPEMSPGLLVNKDSGYLNLNLLPNGGLKYNSAGYFQLCVNWDEVASAESVRALQSQVSAANTKLEETV